MLTRRPLALLWLLCVSGACGRDLTLPPPPGAGALYGRVVVAVPGKGTHVAAPGATIAILGGGLSTVANAAGDFRLEGVEQTEGSLLFRAGAQQRLLDLAEVGTGPGRQIGLGDVVVVDNGSLSGRVLRGDVANGSSGHGGTVIFVPEGPFTAYTGDDGSFTLENLPEGHLEVGFFRPGYAPVTRTGVATRAGEDVTLATVVLRPEADAGPGSLSGTVRFEPGLASAAGTTVSATAPGQPGVSGAVRDDGHFSVPGLAPGLYDLGLAHDGYTSATVANVLVREGVDWQVADVVLTQGEAFDAGTRPPAPDAGVADGGLQGCASSAECPSSQWCDPLFGACRLQCTSAQGCTDGRVCDLPTGTCVRPCGVGCASGFGCDSATQQCRQACDATTPCSTGQRCGSQGLCGPECAVTADCPVAHHTCQAGACVSDHSCGSDLDCGAAELCTGATCVPRQGTATDAGVVYLCANACLCRLDEACESGVCVPGDHPTVFLAADAGGDGRSPGTPSGDLQAALGQGGWLALRADDAFALPGSWRLDAGLTVAGGYVTCGPTRWVRRSDARTTVTVPTGPVFVVAGTPQQPVTGVTLQNLSLFDDVAPSCQCLVEASFAEGLTPAHVDGALRAPHAGCTGPAPMGLFEADHSDGLVLHDVALTGAVPTASSAPVSLVRLVTSSGQLSGLAARGVSVEVPFAPVSISGLSGPLSLDGVELAPAQLSGGTMVGVHLEACGPYPALVTHVHAVVPQAGAAFTGLSVTDCPKLSLTKNTVDGAPTVRTASSTVTGLLVTDSGGVIEDNVVTLPAWTNGPGVGSYVGVQVVGPLAPGSVARNRVTGGIGAVLAGLWLSTLDSGGPLVVADNTIALGQAVSSQGLLVQAVGSGAGLQVHDNSSRAAIYQAACGSGAYGLWCSGSSGVFERNRFYAEAASAPGGAWVTGPGQVELYDNHLWAGRTWAGANCGVAATGLTVVNGGLPVSLYAIGNTIEGDGDVGIASAGIDCGDSAQLFMTSNVVSGGQTPTARVLAHSASTAGCYVPQNFTRNDFSLAAATQPLDPGDAVFTVVPGADAGVPDARGNVVALGSCFDPAAPAPRYQLAAGSRCVDRGLAGQRRDGSALTLDLDGQPRQLGAGVDVGCSEKQ
jgi:hypothetical protein